MRPITPEIGASGSALNEVGEPPRPTLGTISALETAATPRLMAAPTTNFPVAKANPLGTPTAKAKPVTFAIAHIAAWAIILLSTL